MPNDLSHNGQPCFIIRVDNNTDYKKNVSIIDAANSIHRCDDEGIYRRDGVVISNVFSGVNYREMLYFLITNDKKIVGGTYIRKLKINNNKEIKQKIKDFIVIAESNSIDGSRFTQPILFKVDKKQTQKNVVYSTQVYRLGGVGSKFIMNIEPQSSTEVRFFMANKTEFDSSHVITPEDSALLAKLCKSFYK